MPNANGVQVRIIAVSKLKPANDILALHQSEHKHLDFGENYAQELTEKANLLPKSIRWHMIGGLQTNKCKPLAEQVANLYCVSSVDTAKKADALEKGRATLAASQTLESKLRVLVQINTSGEENKSGVEPAEAAELCKHIREKCPHLQLAGLMTIGALARSKDANNVNEDFVALRETRDRVLKDLGIQENELELSMGMSSDFEAAIEQGSDEVRVGTTIFGDRPAKKDAVITS
jgi:PLP dependent protein